MRSIPIVSYDIDSIFFRFNSLAVRNDIQMSLTGSGNNLIDKDIGIFIQKKNLQQVPQINFGTIGNVFGIALFFPHLSKGDKENLLQEGKICFYEKILYPSLLESSTDLMKSRVPATPEQATTIAGNLFGFYKVRIGPEQFVHFVDLMFRKCENLIKFDLFCNM